MQASVVRSVWRIRFLNNALHALVWAILISIGKKIGKF